MFISKTFRKLRQIRMMYIQHDKNPDSHKQERNGKQRIYFSDNLVDWQQGCQHIIQENNDNPEHGIQ